MQLFQGGKCIHGIRNRVEEHNASCADKTNSHRTSDRRRCPSKRFLEYLAEEEAECKLHSKENVYVSSLGEYIDDITLELERLQSRTPIESRVDHAYGNGLLPFRTPYFSALDTADGHRHWMPTDMCKEKHLRHADPRLMLFEGPYGVGVSTRQMIEAGTFVAMFTGEWVLEADADREYGVKDSSLVSMYAASSFYCMTKDTRKRMRVQDGRVNVTQKTEDGNAQETPFHKLLCIPRFGGSATHNVNGRFRDEAGLKNLLLQEGYPIDIGALFNHSKTPNCELRSMLMYADKRVALPCIAIFATAHIEAMSELTISYGYKPTHPGKVDRRAEEKAVRRKESPFAGRRYKREMLYTKAMKDIYARNAFDAYEALTSSCRVLERHCCGPPCVFDESKVEAEKGTGSFADVCIVERERAELSRDIALRVQR